MSVKPAVRAKANGEIVMTFDAFREAVKQNPGAVHKAIEDSRLRRHKRKVKQANKCEGVS
jgi:uncharacterized protein YbaA (DUF1428 family)